MQRAEMREFGVGGQVEKFDRLRQLQQGGVANRKLLASEMTAQIAQASAGCRSLS